MKLLPQFALGVCLLWSTTGLADNDAPKEVLRMGISGEFKVLYQGYLRFTQQLFKELGWELVPVELPTARTVYAANSGELDGDLFRVRQTAEQYPNLILVPTSFYTQQFFLYVFPEAQCPSPDHLEQIKMGRLLGAVVFDYFPEEIRRNLIDVPSLQSYLNMLGAGRLDAIPLSTELYNALHYAKGMTLKRCDDLAIFESTVHIFLHRKHEDKVAELDRLLQAHQKELESITIYEGLMKK